MWRRLRNIRALRPETNPYAASIAFLAVALLLSLTLAGIGMLFTSNGSVLVALHSLGVALAVVAWRSPRRLANFSDATAVRAHVVAAVLPFMYFIPLTYVYWLFATTTERFPMYSVPLPTAVVLTLISALLEEVGWRDYLMPVTERVGWIRGNVTIGLIWAAWHYPAIIVGAYHVVKPTPVGMILFTVNVILLSMIFAWLRVRSGGVFAVSLLHGAHNIAYHVLVPAVALHTNGLLVAESGLGLTASLLLVIAAFRAWSRPMTVRTMSDNRS